MQAAGDTPDDRPRQGAALGGVREAAREHLLEGRRRPAHTQKPRRARRRRRDDHQGGPLPVRADRVGELGEGGFQALLHATVARAIGRADPLGAAAGDQVEGRQEAFLLVREQLIEGTARDARQADDLPDARARVAVRGHGLDHRSVHARALVAHDLLVGETMGSVRQALVQGSHRFPALSLSASLRRRHSISQN